MERRPFARRVLAVLLVAVLPGCSWIFVHKAPEEPIPRSPPLVCTSSAASPILDTVGTAILGATGVATTIVAASAKTTTGMLAVTSEQKTAGVLVGVALMGGATALGFSAAYGYDRTSECRGLKEAQLACVSGTEGACKALEAREPWRSGLSPGEACKDSAQCETGNVCQAGRCQPGRP